MLLFVFFFGFCIEPGTENHFFKRHRNRQYKMPQYLLAVHYDQPVIIGNTSNKARSPSLSLSYAHAHAYTNNTARLSVT